MSGVAFSRALRPLVPLASILVLALAACASDATIDLSIRAWDGSPLGDVEVVVCSARDRTDVIDTVELGPGSSSTLRIPADGRAVAFAAVTVDRLCAASCQVELDEGATFEGTLDLFPCLACPRADPTAAEVCRDPLCFVASEALSACE